jgi:hypothetical protein
MFQPSQTRRPQAQSKAKVKKIANSSIVTAKSSSPDVAAKAGDLGVLSETQVKTSSIDQWQLDREEDEYWENNYKEEEKRKRKRSKKKHGLQRPTEESWDDIYDPAHPINYEEYIKSDAYIEDLRELDEFMRYGWKGKPKSKYPFLR